MGLSLPMTLTLVCGILSVLGSSFIIITYTIFTIRLKRFGAHFIVTQACADFFFGWIFITKAVLSTEGHNITDPAKPFDYYCTITATIDQFLAQATTAWSCVMSITVYRAYYNAAHFRATNPRYVLCHICVWTMCATNAISLYFLKAYAPAATGCFMKSEYELFASVPITIYYLGSVFVLIYVVYKNRQGDANVRQVSQDKSIIQIRKYVVVFASFWTVPVVTCYMVYFGLVMPQLVNMLVIVCVSLQGFGNSIAWGTSPRLIRAFKDTWNMSHSYKPLNSDVSLPKS